MSHSQKTRTHVAYRGAKTVGRKSLINLYPERVKAWGEWVERGTSFQTWLKGRKPFSNETKVTAVCMLKHNNLCWNEKTKFRRRNLRNKAVYQCGTDLYITTAKTHISLWKRTIYHCDTASRDSEVTRHPPTSQQTVVSWVWYTTLHMLYKRIIGILIWP